MAWCPLCECPVRARCRQVNVWHWSHVQGGDCDTWAEPESRWHRAYKLIVPRERREVRLGQHRADMVNPYGAVLELQHSPLSVDEIEAREAHYGVQMRWLFDARAAYWKGRITLRYKEGDSGGSYVTFRWKHARRSITACARPVFLDLGQGLLLQVKKAYPGPPFNGWGYLHRTADMWNWLLTGSPPTVHLNRKPGAEAMKNWVSHYAAVLSSRCALPDDDVTAVLQESLIPPDGTITSNMLYALLKLQAENAVPAGLATYISEVKPVDAEWLNADCFSFRCPACAKEPQHRGYTVTESVLATMSCGYCLSGALVRVPSR